MPLLATFTGHTAICATPILRLTYCIAFSWSLLVSDPALHRMTEAQLSRILSLLAAAGGTPRTPATWQQDNMTALLLGENESPIMPLSRRTLRIAPDASAPRTLLAGWITS